MKKLLLLCLIFAACGSVAFAQVKIGNRTINTKKSIGSGFGCYESHYFVR